MSKINHQYRTQKSLVQIWKHLLHSTKPKIKQTSTLVAICSENSILGVQRLKKSKKKCG